MAYIGLARPVIAKYPQDEEGYTRGFRFGKAVKIEISPQYEDVSDYNDINDTEDVEIFSYADITLGISTIPKEAENLAFGHENIGNETIYRDEDISGYVGLGIRTREVIAGAVQYVALWLYKVRLKEESQTHEAKGESIDYATPSVKGKAYPDKDGKWKKKKLFNTEEEADSWLNEMAGINQKEEE